MVASPVLKFGEGSVQSQIPLEDRLSIGRSKENCIIVSDASILPIQACILVKDNRCYIEDCGGESATVVNDKPVVGTVSLKDGDVIQIGSARMTVSGLTSEEESSSSAIVRDETKIEFQCQCGKKLRAPRKYSGRRAKCAKCGHQLIVPGETAQQTSEDAVANLPESAAVSGTKIHETTTVPESTATRLHICSYCSFEIDEELDDTTTCDVCELPFHTDCWTENSGCSAFGCKNDHILSPAVPPFIIDDGQNQSEISDLPTNDMPWGNIFLAMNLIGSLFGLLLCGIPALFTGIGAFYFSQKKRLPDNQQVLVNVSVVIGAIGFLIGLIVSLLV